MQGVKAGGEGWGQGDGQGGHQKCQREARGVGGAGKGQVTLEGQRRHEIWEVVRWTLEGPKFVKLASYSRIVVLRSFMSTAS